MRIVLEWILGVSLLLCMPLRGDMLELAGRAEGEEERADYASRILLDYGGLEAGLLYRMEAPNGNDREYPISGGLSLPLFSSFVKAGSLTLSGPLSELSSPTEAGALSPLYYRYPSVGLYRGWDPGESLAVAWGIPGMLWGCYQMEPDAPAKTSLCATYEILPGLRLEASGLYTIIPEVEEEEWILSEGMPATGEHLLAGLGLIRQGRSLDLSLFGAGSFHPLLPAGRYLRLQLRNRGACSLVGVRLSAADRRYRTPKDHLPPFACSGAAELQLFPGGRLKPLLVLDGRREHAPLDASAEFDWRASAAGGIEYATRKLDASLRREAELRREEGEHLSRERILGTAAWRPSPGSFIEVDGTYLLGRELLERADLAAGIRRSGLKFSSGVGWKRESEFGEIPAEPVSSCRAEFAYTGDSGYVRLKMELEDEKLKFRIEGGRRFSDKIIAEP